MGFKKYISPSLAFMLAIIIQIQITLEYGGTKIRLNLADPFIAVLVIVALYVGVKNWRTLKNRLENNIPLLFFLATLVFTGAFIIGYWNTGFFTWAVVKYAGWYVLMAYFAIGIFIAAISGKPAFVIGFVAGNVFVILMQFILLPFHSDIPIFPLGRFEGFSGNSNAFGFMLVCGLALCSSHIKAINQRLARGMAEVFCAIILTGIYYSGSISALLTTVLVLALLLSTGLQWRKFVFIIILATIFTVLPRLSDNIIPSKGWYTKAKIVIMLTGKRTDWVYKSTIEARLDALWEGFALWQQSPVFGAGLGVQLFEQKRKAKKNNPPLVQIHNTGIWLLAEIGLVGLLIFIFLFIALIKQIWRNSNLGSTGPPDNFAIAALICLLAWLLASQFHELMYQRVIWLIAGMAVWRNVQKKTLPNMASKNSVSQA